MPAIFLKGCPSLSRHPAPTGKVPLFEMRSFVNLPATAFARPGMTREDAEPAEGSLPEGALRFDSGPVGKFDLLDHYLASGFILRVKVDGQIAPGAAGLKAHGDIWGDLPYLHRRPKPCETPPLILPSPEKLFCGRRDRPANAHLIAARGLIDFAKASLPVRIPQLSSGPTSGKHRSLPSQAGRSARAPSARRPPRREWQTTRATACRLRH